MQTLRLVYNWLEMIFGAFWVATLFDYFSIINVMQFSLQEAFNSFLHSIFLAFGVLFFALGGWYKHKIKNEEIISKKLANKKMQMDIDRIEANRKKN